MEYVIFKIDAHPNALFDALIDPERGGHSKLRFDATPESDQHIIVLGEVNQGNYNQLIARFGKFENPSGTIFMPTINPSGLSSLVALGTGRDLYYNKTGTFYNFIADKDKITCSSKKADGTSADFFCAKPDKLKPKEQGKRYLIPNNGVDYGYYVDMDSDSSDEESAKQSSGMDMVTPRAAPIEDITLPKSHENTTFKIPKMTSSFHRPK